MKDLDAIIAVTGDHGMSDKSNPDGTPNVIFVEDELSNRMGKNCARVICPILDPFVHHHGALGSFVRVYVSAKNLIRPMIDFCMSMPDVETARSREEAALIFEQPLDREGDFVVIAKKKKVR